MEEAKFITNQYSLNGYKSHYEWKFSTSNLNKLNKVYIPSSNRYNFEIELFANENSLNHKILLLEELPKNFRIDYQLISIQETTTSGTVFWDNIMSNNAIPKTHYGDVSGKILFTLIDSRNKPIRSPSIETTLKYYEDLFKSGQLSDIIFVAQDGEEIPVNKCIVSRNEVFAKMIESDMQEKKNGRVEISDIEAGILKLILCFLYCGQIRYENIEDLLKVLIAADKYSMTNLIQCCESRLEEKLSVLNVIDVLTTADLLNLKSLKISCLGLIKNNKNAVIKTEKFNEIVKSHAHLVSEIALLKE